MNVVTELSPDCDNKALFEVGLSMEKLKQRNLESFVARIWLEHGKDGDPVWRGHIRHVQNGREAYFQDLGEMREFLEQVSDVPGPTP